MGADGRGCGSGGCERRHGAPGNVAQIYARSGLSQDAANARAFLFYSFIFGQSLLFAGRDAAKQRRLLDQCARVLAEI